MGAGALNDSEDKHTFLLCVSSLSVQAHAYEFMLLLL